MKQAHSDGVLLLFRALFECLSCCENLYFSLEDIYLKQKQKQQQQQRERKSGSLHFGSCKMLKGCFSQIRQNRPIFSQGIIIIIFLNKPHLQFYM